METKKELTTIETESVRRLLAVNDPNQVDINLVAKIREIPNVKLEFKTKEKFGPHGYEEIFQGFDIEIPNKATAIKIVEMVKLSMLPLPVNQIEAQLDLLANLVVKPAGINDQQYSKKRKAMALQLSVFPADIVATAIARVAETCTFFPAYKEFCDHILWRIKLRTRLFDALTSKMVDFTA
tara:strand:- start:194 stop:736 length:543 start_codon:yes stop_codon:yes gene_type:complete